MWWFDDVHYLFGFDGCGLQALAQTISLLRRKNVAGLLSILDQPKINFDFSIVLQLDLVLFEFCFGILRRCTS